MFDLGTQELIVIFIVALLVFGPKRLPELARTLGKGINELKAALRGVKESIEESEVTEEIKKARSVVEEELIKGSPLEVYTEGEKAEKIKTHREEDASSEPLSEEEKKEDG
jgi:Tat protein translocase TatB subunit